MHAARKQGELSSEQINQIWMQVQKESLGDAIKLDKELPKVKKWVDFLEEKSVGGDPAVLDLLAALELRGALA